MVATGASWCGGQLASAAGASARAGVAAPAVQVMVVGAGNVVLSGPRSVTAGGATVRTSGRSCGVAAGTPLAALADLHQLGGPAFAIRDYGRCTSSPRASGQLFVYSLDGETNHGQNGWEYKVDNLSGTTGAGDPTGPQGDGRLLAPGAQVLWFWCQAFAGGCQRTLALSAPRSLARGAAVQVRVTGYDNYGRGTGMSGARVRLGGASAVTGGAGVVTLRAPSRAGGYTLSASRPGSVPAFPETLTVR
ncbi:MAG TPA: hypothetical protein VNV44_05965 [Solirubrobacteraceae bacterium]|nr:hypothetical protein [Solirubrobacteraceae bacterium]